MRSKTHACQASTPCLSQTPGCEGKPEYDLGKAFTSVSPAFFKSWDFCANCTNSITNHISLKNLKEKQMKRWVKGGDWLCVCAASYVKKTQPWKPWPSLNPPGFRSQLHRSLPAVGKLFSFYLLQCPRCRARVALPALHRASTIDTHCKHTSARE